MKVSKFSSLVQAKVQLSQAPEDFSKLFEEIDTKKDNSASITKAIVLKKEDVLSAKSAFRGKKGHADYNQVTIYLRKDTHNKAKIALLQNGTEKDFSEFVEDLLQKFLAG